MKLVKGDKLVCVKPIEELVYGKTYLVVDTRSTKFWGKEEEDICTMGTHEADGSWWFGQIGSTEPWTNWFVLEKQWLRVEKLKELGI